MYTQEELNAVNEVKNILDNYEKYQGKVSYLIEDADRKILFCNKSFCDLAGIEATPEQMIGYDCSNAAEETKHLFKDSEKFVADINEIFNNRSKKTTHIIEKVNGKKYRRDYVPLFFSDNYIGHTWQYYEI